MSQVSDNDHVKTVYANFGLAIYLAQVLEYGLAYALICTELLPRRAGKPVPRKQWESEFDSFLNEQFEKPLGRLISGLRNVTSIPADLEILLTSALKARNFLAHHFFRERAILIISRDGREKMLDELESAQRLFEAADEKLTEIVKPIREKYGLTDEKLKPYEQKYLTNLKRISNVCSEGKVNVTL